MVERAAIERGEVRRLDAVEAEQLLAEDLVTRDHQAGGTGAGVAEAHQVHQRGQARVQRALALEGLGEVEDELRRGLAQARQHGLDTVGDGERSDGMSALAQRTGDIVEHRIRGRAQRIRAVQDYDLHSAPPRALPMASV